MQSVVLAQVLFGLDLPTLLLIGAAVLFLFALVSLALVLRAQRRQRRVAEQRAREEAERRAREEAERRAREEADRRERLEAERRAREEAEERAREEAERREREEEERREREEADRRAREEAELRAREEATRRAKEEAARRTREEAARKEASRKAQEEAARRAQEEARRARAEAERKAQEEIERLSRQPRPQTSPAPRPTTGRQPAQPQAQVHRPASLAQQQQQQQQQQARPAAQPKASVEPPVAVPAGPVKKVLLVEDSKTMRKVFALVLAGEGFNLTAVASGHEALPKAREVRPDLVIADLSLDDLDGYEICREIRRDGQLSRTPVLLLHGPSVELDEARVNEVQASQVLAKPFETDDLLNALRELTGSVA